MVGGCFTFTVVVVALRCVVVVVGTPIDVVVVVGTPVDVVVVVGTPVDAVVVVWPPEDDVVVVGARAPTAPATSVVIPTIERAPMARPMMTPRGQ